jgi:hypothetical protein
MSALLLQCDIKSRAKALTFMDPYKRYSLMPSLPSCIRERTCITRTVKELGKLYLNRADVLHTLPSSLFAS